MFVCVRMCVYALKKNPEESTCHGGIGGSRIGVSITKTQFKK